jgi:hypothetical protein
MPAPYSKIGTIMADGIPLLEVGKFELGGDSNDKPIKTTAQGLAGFNDGAEECTGSLDSAIPAAGREKDYFDICMSHQDIVIACTMAGKIRTARGRLMNVKETTSVDVPNEISATFHGKYIRT